MAVLTSILIVCLLISCGNNTDVLEEITSTTAAVETTTAEKPSQDEAAKPDPVKLRFIVMSDIHMGGSDPISLKNGLKKAKSMSNNMLDAALFCGDLTNTTGLEATPSTTEIGSFKNTVRAILADIPKLYCLGPAHDTPEQDDGEPTRKLFETVFDKSYYSNNTEPDEIASKGARHTVLKEYHFFSLDYEGTVGGISPEVLTWLDSELATLTADGSDKPIFVMYHVPDYAPLIEVLKNYPQVICFTGHLHNPLAREDSIEQDNGFTSVHCGGMYYYRVDGYNRANSNPFLDLGNIYNFAQNLYVEVDENNNVKITRVDSANDAIIGEPWVVGPQSRDAYSSNRKASYKPCMFENGDALKIEQIKINDSPEIKVTFDGCTMGEAGPAMYYTVEFYKRDTNGEYILQKHVEIGSQQALYPNDENIPAGHYSYTTHGIFDELDITDYAVVVKAVDCWGESSNAMVYANGGYVHSGTVGGKTEHTVTTKQALEFSYDESNKKASYFSTRTTMAVRFNSTSSFTDIRTICSSQGDTVGTLTFTLYKWDETYEKTLQGTAIDTYNLVNFFGSKVYTVLDGTYEEGEYLMLVTTPKASEGVGLYFYPMTSGDGAYISYENGTPAQNHIYLSWTNFETNETPYLPYKE